MIMATPKPIDLIALMIVVAARSSTSFCCIRRHFLLSTAVASSSIRAEGSSCRGHRHCHIVMHSSSRVFEEADADYENDDEDDVEEADISNNDDISWRIAKLQLEEANTRRFLKAKPIKLDYTTSSTWICKNYDISTKKEFMDLVANGQLRTPYISKDPETYYGVRGQWISWDHYLGVGMNKQSSNDVTDDDDKTTLSSDDDDEGQESTIAQWQ